MLSRNQWGDESVLVKIEENITYGNSEGMVVPDYAAAIRVGDLVLVVVDQGWEAAKADVGLVRELAGKAARRAQSAR